MGGTYDLASGVTSQAGYSRGRVGDGGLRTDVFRERFEINTCGMEGQEVEPGERGDPDTGPTTPQLTLWELGR